MPRERRLPDMHGIDRVELQLAVLDVLDERGFGPEWRKVMNDSAQIGAVLDSAGGAPGILAEALRRLRRPVE